MNNVKYCKIKADKFLHKFFVAIFSLLFLGIADNILAAKIPPEQEPKLQNHLLFSLNKENAAIKDILYEIQEKTGYSFMFEEEELDKMKKSIHLQNTTLKACLDELFEATPYTYEINGKTIAVLKRTKAVSPEKHNRVKGKVIDEQKEPVIGATILIEGTTVGVVTDVNGGFQLEVPAGSMLVISFLGMEPQKYRVNQSVEELVIILKPDVKSMDEVIVTGMFTRKAESFTGAARTITGKEFERVGNGNLFQSLRNLDPSLSIMDNLEFGSDPNKLPAMQLRGTSTFPVEGNTELRSNYQDDPNQPLFILDGFEASATKIFDLDMNRVESVTILKDAAAKAIYGSKAANGVVVIETKRPLGGEFRVNYKGSVDITVPDLSSYNLANALEKLEIERIAGIYESDYLPSHQKLQDRYNERMKAALEGLNTDWLAKPLRTGIGTKHALSFEMGNQNLTAIADVSYNRVNGVMKGSYREVIAGDVNLAYRLNSKFLFRNIMSITSNRSEDSPYGDFSEYAAMNPYFSPYDKLGKITKDNNNPMYNATLNTKRTSGYLEFTNNFYTEYTILDGLKAVGRIGVTAQSSTGDIFYPANHTRFSGWTDDRFLQRGSYQQNNGKYTSLNGDLTLQYSKTFDKHLLMANFAFSISGKKHSEVIHYAEGFPSDRMDDITFALQYAENKTPGGSESIVRDVGFTGVLGYTYDNRFLADLTVRENASSQFGAENRWGLFWSAGIGWNVHNEKFMQELEWVKLLKLRGSVGTTGSQSFASYQTIATYKYYTDVSYAGMLGAYVMRLANDNLKWQEKMDYNVGLDARLWKFTLSFDYYESITDNLIVDLSLPTSVGFSSVKENIGKIKNNGFDIALTWHVFSGADGFLNLTGSLTTNQNKIMKLSDAMRAFNERQDELVESKLGGGRSKPVLRYVEGGSLNSIWAVPSLGINPANGREIYIRPDGTTTYTWQASDQQIVGNSQEKFRGNFGFNGEYKGFGLSVISRFTAGGDYYNQTLVDKVENADLNRNVDRRILYGRWSETNKNAPFKTLQPYNDADGNYVAVPKTEPTSRFVQRKNEMTISSISAWYDWRNRTWLNKAGISRLKLAFNMNDVCTFSTIRMERGTSYPFARTMSFSLAVEF